jgi:peptidoglycan/xylan/chitin deacetylase (PgdA/CDA1 family)
VVRPASPGKIVATVLLAVVLVGGVMAVTLWIPPRLLVAVTADIFDDVFFYADTTQPVVALTLDDEPDPATTGRILDVLARHQVRATFFLIGSHCAAHPDLVTRIRAAGHELANHHWQDEPSISLGPADFVAGLNRTEALVQPGGSVKWFRPGSGWFDGPMIDQLAEHGYLCCLGSVYPYDNLIRRVQPILASALAGTFPGAVLVLHGGGRQRVYVSDVLEQLIPKLRQRGYRFVTVTELWELAGRRPRLPGGFDRSLD